MSIYTALITFFVTLKNSVTESSNSTSSEGVTLPAPPKSSPVRLVIWLSKGFKDCMVTENALVKE
ncbi:hypothetical protein Lbys_0553 [Leadbetterella byssophila DSM 17132]|uniref:Uncharacterized protein n=1 Tax=Leadbetterella byssophila (strain DSM 17132 / JCM 16389 / KACC 11308 / NBRC 106382 / 4M15) TaxID=649349 RepID=E4RXH4_LEAB4|nr:hypothetical protein Lbys_0553 [Leadbetterella byssophila DSM 17132]